MTDDINLAKINLKKTLDNSFNAYMHLLRKWFHQKMTKEEFDAQARLLFTPENIHYHNDFLAALLSKCHIKQQIKRPHSPTLTGFKALKKIKKSTSVSANLNEKCFQNNSLLSSADVVDASTALASAHVNGITEVLCAKEGILPDPSMVHGRLLLVCWENDLEDVSVDVVPLVLYALRDALKNLIHACIELRRPYLIHDGKFQHLFGSDTSSSNNLRLPSVRHRVVGETMELKQNGLMATTVSRPKTRIAPFDLYQALTIRPNLIPSHSLYSLVMERLRCSGVNESMPNSTNYTNGYAK